MEVRDLDVTLAGTPVLRDVSLDLPAGEVLAVLGPSGCGKSTLLRAVAGLERLDRGAVRVGGQDVTRVPTYRRGFALMFQDGQLFGHLTVAQNVAYPLRLRRVGRRERAARAAELLELVGVPGFGDRDPATLSGGERQRVALARALAVEPRLLLLDEPLSALDRDLRERLAVDLRRILTTAGTTALLVTHDHDEAFAVADRMALLRAGRLVQDGTLEEVWRHPVDAEAARFLGYARVLTADQARPLRAAYADRSPDGRALALRRSALQVDAAGSVPATVVTSRSTPEQTRLVVRLEDGLELDAVAPAGRACAAGELVRLTLDVTRVAPLPTHATPTEAGPDVPTPGTSVE
ncbi:ABC transporter ATP-binding protein [Nocardioides sp. HDW12B]|nr:ABC transporter ATP-binding protein [Nocardioides sp. HDW12B]